MTDEPSPLLAEVLNITSQVSDDMKNLVIFRADWGPDSGSRVR